MQLGPSERYDTVSEAARRLAVAENTVREYVRRGVLTAIRVGSQRARLIPTDAVEALALKRRNGDAA